MRTRSRSARPALLVGAGLLLLAACGSGGGGGSSSPSTGSSPSGGTGSVAVGSTSAGTVLVDPAGMTLYAFANDSKGHSTCSGSCATYWPPVPGADAPNGATSSVMAKFGTIKRSDGSSQLTVNGFPMYTYAGDSAPGQANGQGKDLSGGLWWVVAPDGSWVEGSGAPSGAGGGY
ncbi:COG4315 family predicted lipoprotein [Nocardioides sp. MAHUQ-72]|uniref:COG4315 family predicted lipoprotein n=1 Tax=unclassified Nocardioides TaxID=2615069 RepID=UPI00360E9DA2